MNDTMVFNYLLKKIKDEVLILGDKLQKKEVIDRREINFLGHKIDIITENYYNPEYLNHFNNIGKSFKNISYNYDMCLNFEKELATISLEINELIDITNKLIPEEETYKKTNKLF